MSDIDKVVYWGLYGYFPFTRILVAVFTSEAEARKARQWERDKGPHMGESWTVEAVEVYDEASKYMEEGW